MYYKLGQVCVTNRGSFVLLQIRANVVTNWGSFIVTNQGQQCYKLGQLLQIRATVITKLGSYYKLGQNLLQIGAGIKSQGNYYKLGHNSYEGSYSKKYQDHIPCSFAYKLVCVDDKFTKPTVVFRGENATYEFIGKILKEYQYCKKSNEETL